MGEIPEEDHLPFGPTEYNRLLPIVKGQLNYDSDEYTIVFEMCF